MFNMRLEIVMNIFSRRVGVAGTVNEAVKQKSMQAFVKVAGTGCCLPHAKRMSADIDRELKRKAGKTEARTGVRERRMVTHETSSSMAVMAAKDAISSANRKATDIDLIISACAVPEQPIPAMAPLIQAGLGLGATGIPAFDINASCLSFVTAFDLAAQLIEAKRFRNVLVVSSEIASRALPWSSDPDTAAMFGDGAAAAVLSSSETRSGGLAASHFETWSKGYHDCELAAGGTRYDFHTDRDAFAMAAQFRMDGRAAYRLAAKVIQPFLQNLLDKAGWIVDEIDLVVPHQASRGALDHLIAKLNIPRSKIIDIIADHGNQIAASIPMALHHAMRGGLIRSKMKVLVIGTSAGFSIGGLCLEIP
jgi:3-oxoacyl-[acyl-carrier-protein] synthase-3